MKIKWFSLLLIAFLFNVATVSAQKWSWGEAGNNVTVGVVNSSNVATNKTGNVYQTGGFQYSDTFGTHILTSSNFDTYLVKYDQCGNLLWVKQSICTGDSSNGYAIGYSVATDDSDNSYITGYGQFGVAFGPDTLNFYGYFGQYFLVKYDHNGNVVWAKKANSDIGNAPSWSVATDKFGHEYITGAGAFLIKYDKNGNVIWTIPKTTDSYGFTQGFSVATDISGNVYIAGQFVYGLTFGSDTLYSNYSSVFIAKFDSNGNALWAQQSVDSSTHFNPFNHGIYAYYSVAADNSDAAYLIGSFGNGIRFGSYKFTSINNSASNFFVVKYNPDGTIAWGKEDIPIDGSSWFGWSICTDDSNHVYISGTGATESAAFVFANDTINIKDITNYYDLPAFLIKLDSSGQVIYSSTLPVSGQEPNAVTADFTGKFVYLGGAYNISFVLGNDSLINNTGETDTYIAGWHSPCGCDLEVTADSQSLVVCYGRNITLRANGGDNYTWSPSNGLSATTGDSVIVTATATTTYTVITKGGSCGIDSSQIVVFIIPSPNKPTFMQRGDTLISSAKYDNLWYRNDTLLKNDTSQYLIINIAGEYLVNVLNEANGCSTSSDSTYVTPSGFNEVSIYPNPTNNQITVQINSSSTDLSGWKLKLIDILGRTIYSMPSLNYSNIINLETLPAAMYFVTVTNNTGRTVVPVVKVN